MKEADWKNIKYFSAKENWGNWKEMDVDLIHLLDTLRGLFKFPFIVHCGFQTRPVEPGHKPSQHNYGKACDFHIEGIDFKDAVDLMLDFISNINVENIIGLGIYPHWNNPGFHLDTRGEKARWGAVIKKGKQVYVNWDEAYRKIR